MTTIEALQKLSQDPEMIAKAEAECKTVEDSYELLKACGLTDDFETFKASAMEVNEALSKLDEKDIDAVGGGSSATVTTVTTTIPLCMTFVI
ncbi:MAG: hypothetical protein Q4B73_06675 [Lachnospiraceae bacterium]|nr:hypothetical protein [Lachnospiraceae bacterium]